jgi:LPXTG-motif cell wall-anchored protein
MSRMLNDLAALNQLADVVSLQEMMARRPLSYRDFGDDGDASSVISSLTTGLSTLATGVANVYTAVAGQPKPAATAPIAPPATSNNTMLYLGIGAAVLILGGGFLIARRRR